MFSTRLVEGAHLMMHWWNPRTVPPGALWLWPPAPPPIPASTRVPARATLVRGRGARPLLRLPYHTLPLSLSPCICTFTSSPIRPSLFHCACLSSALGCLLCGWASGIHWGENKSQNSSAPFGNFGKKYQKYMGNINMFSTIARATQAKPFLI